MQDLKAAHLPLLEEILRDLSGEPSFPTCMDAATLIWDTLKDPEASLERVAKAVSIEPLIASKVLRMANAAARNPSGKIITALPPAISTLGFECVRTISLAVALDQLLKTPKLAIFSALAKKTWTHSLHLAAIARVLARHIGRINPDEAMLCGLVSHIGIFYLLYRAADKPAYQQDNSLLTDLLQNHHQSTGTHLLQSLALPDHIITALQTPISFTPQENPLTLSEVLYFAELLTDETLPWSNAGVTPIDNQARETDRSRYANLLEEAAEDISAMQAALA